MNEAISTTSSILIDKLADWLMTQALENATLEEIVAGCCERLSASGLPLARGHLSFSMLHPLYRAMGFTWRRGKGIEVEGYRHVSEGDTDQFVKSPYYYLLTNNLDHLRCHLESAQRLEFPIHEDLKAEGLSDYLAFISPFHKDQPQGMIGSWSTDRAGGFRESEISALLRIQMRLAVACKTAVQGSLARNMLETYLGGDAGKRVLSGQVRRGDGETTRAAIIMADIRNSTVMAETLGRQGYINALNLFFDNVGSAFADAGGEILSFVGDGFLAVFPCGRNKTDSTKACEQAYGAAREALVRMEQANIERETSGEERIKFGIGLHIGNVMFGNVGLEDRLAFSAFGSTVNEASRLEALTKKYHTPLIASEDFKYYTDTEDWTELGQETLRGINEPLTVYSPTDYQTCSKTIKIKPRHKNLGYSAAENVVLLHRGSPKKAS
ncbi:MAG: adenylate/guanylate cyclase domain-containing protein [Rhizobiales bacterium]|nr:adenylate/guanylate cyclase domain-containing protein [Hyphomicrobiales bacterium]